MNQLKTSRKAFTLIELLVVIAIIAILAAILFPVFAKVREKGQETQCISNTGQISKANQMYANDWNGTYLSDDPLFPRFVGIKGNNMLITPAGNVKVTPGLLDKYLKSIDIIKCPRRPKRAQSVAVINGWGQSDTNPRGPWEFGPFRQRNPADPNRNMAGVPDTLGIKESAMDQPAMTITFWEHNNTVEYCNVLQAKDWCLSAPRDKDTLNHFNQLHTEGAVMTFADGHTKRITLQTVKRPWYSVNKSIYTAINCK